MGPVAPFGPQRGTPMTRRLHVLAVALSIATTGLARNVRAQSGPLIPLAPEFQANSWTTNVQSAPSVAAGPAGGFVVVWPSYGGAADASSLSVQGQRYDGGGTPLGAQFQVNTYTTGFQSAPAVASVPD